jgi:hypothetical protein
LDIKVLHTSSSNELKEKHTDFGVLSPGVETHLVFSNAFVDGLELLNVVFDRL